MSPPFSRALTSALADSTQPADFGINKFEAGLLFAFVNFGTVVAWLLIRKADIWGRRTVMMVTIVGYTVFTFTDCWDVWSFALFQFIARIFSSVNGHKHGLRVRGISTDRRATVIGVLKPFPVWALCFVGVTPMLLASSFGWRTVYFVGVIPSLFSHSLAGT